MSVSVVIPTYNLGHTIHRAIDSLSGPIKEVIVIDDGSTDGTAVSNVRYIWQSNQGVSAARNRGIREATGEYVAFLDADDIWTVGSLEERMNYIHEADAVIGTTRVMGREVYCTHFGATLMRADIFDRVGVFDTTLTFGEDTDFFLRMKETGCTLRQIPFCVQEYTPSITNRDMKELLPILHRSIKRRENVSS